MGHSQQNKIKYTEKIERWTWRYMALSNLYDERSENSPYCGTIDKGLKINK